MLISISFWQLVIDQFKSTTALEWFGVLTALACIYLATKQHILNWPIGILSSGAYAILYFDYTLYGDAFLQLYFLLTAIYGWYYWIKKKKENTKPIYSLTKKEYVLTIVAIGILSILLGLFLDHFTNTDVPYADGFCTAMSFVGQFFMTRKILQSWILWIVVDICYVPLLIYKDLNLTTLLYVVLIILAVMGYLNWRKDYLNHATTEA